MNIVNIPLNTRISTEDDDILKQEPEYSAKNSIVYKGLLSNMTIKEGNGFLSTTGKEITVDGNVIKADGSVLATYDSDKWKVKSTDTFVSENKICSANATTQISVTGTNTIKVGNKEYSWSSEGSTVISVGGTFLDNSDTAFALAWSYKNTTENAYYVYIKVYSDKDNLVKEGSVAIDNGVNINIYCFATDKMSGCVLSDRYVIGFDADDYRRRGAILLVNDTFVASHGFGCIDNKGLATGEPVVAANFRDDATVNSNGIAYYLFKANDNSASGPDVSGNNRYKILDNGVIRFWNGFFKEDLYKSDILSQNAALGESPSTTSGSQSNVGNWNPFYHMYGNTNNSTPETGTAWNTWDDDGFNERNTNARWIYAIDFSKDLSSGKIYGLPLEFGMNPEQWEFAFEDDYCYQCVPHWTTFIDYSVGAGKLSKEVLDSDVIFPRMNVFFNLSSSRGKYWDYGKGWCQFFKHTVGTFKLSKEVVVLSKPLELFTYTSSNDTETSFGEIDASSVPYDFEELWGTDYGINSSYERAAFGATQIVEPLSNWVPAYTEAGYNEHDSYRYYRMNSGLFVSATEKKPAYDDSTTPSQSSTIYFDRWYFLNGKGGSGSSGSWYEERTNNTRWYKSTYMIVRKHKIVGSGADSDWVYNFGGNGDNSAMTVLPHSEVINASMFSETEKGSGLQSLIYNGVQSGLAFDKTLLFTPSDMDNKFWLNISSDEIKISTWNDSEVTTITLSKDAPIVIDKLTDYMFRVNVLNDQNLIIESHDGILKTERGFIPYNMEHRLNGIRRLNMLLPEDGSTSNDVWYAAAGYNINLENSKAATSFLLPSITLNGYLNNEDSETITSDVLTNKHSPFSPTMIKAFNANESIDAFYTHTQGSTDLTYKTTNKLPAINNNDSISRFGNQTFDTDKDNTSWWITSDTVIYPIAIGSGVSGINYITSTINLPDNYSVRFYTNNNKVFAAYNSVNSIYYGSQIFTVMGGNYYFDGQGIYYLGTGTDYSQNTFIAYALGMKFIANSSSEAYFYSPYDKHFYLFTSSNTLQMAESFAAMGEIIDSVYCPVNQTLYVLFDDGELYLKTQDDSCIIWTNGDVLQSTADGVQVINSTENTYVIHSPYLYENKMNLNTETEWLGNTDTLFKYSWADVVLYCKEPKEQKVIVRFETINGTDIKSIKKEVTIKKEDWKNQLYKIRIVPSEPVGNAFKLYVYSEDASIFYQTVILDKVSQKTGAPINGRI